MLISFFVPGIPTTKGSSKAFAYKGKDGKAHAAVTSANPLLHGWESRIYDVARIAWGDRPPYAGPVAAKVSLYFPRPASHLSSKGVPKPSAPMYPTKKRLDLDKLMRAIFDPLTGVVLHDDTQVCAFQETNKLWLPTVCEHGPGAFVRLFRLTPFVGGEHA